MREVSDLNDSSAELMRVEAEMKRSENLIALLDSRAKELRLEKEAAPSLNVQVLEKGWASKKPAWPDLKILLALGTMLGVMFGIGAAKAYDVTSSNRLASPEQVRNLWDLPVLSHVPAVNHRTHTGAHASAAPSLREAFCVLRTAVLFGFRQEKVLLVTSPLAGDGKSTVSTGLAVALANASHRTLLVDCDLRRPSINRVFKIPNDVGLTSALSSPDTAETAIVPTSTPLLDVLPSGPIPPNPAELLNSRAFTDLLQKLARRYDRIILDSAPVLAAADSRIISALGAATLLVVRCGTTRVKVVERACESLRSVGGNVVGLVLNRVPRNRDEYYDYGGYTAVQYRLYDPENQPRNGNGKVTVNLPAAAGSGRNAGGNG
jgi:succinoglycan biosynthesis transport protein ExoP